MRFLKVLVILFFIGCSNKDNRPEKFKAPDPAELKKQRELKLKKDFEGTYFNGSQFELVRDCLNFEGTVCNTKRLPLIEITGDAANDTQQILFRTIAKNQWMYNRFERVIRSLPPQLLVLFKNVRAIEIGPVGDNPSKDQVGGFAYLNQNALFLHGGWLCPQTSGCEINPKQRPFSSKTLPFTFSFAWQVALAEGPFLKQIESTEDPAVLSKFVSALIHELAHLAEDRSQTLTLGQKKLNGYPWFRSNFFDSLSPQLMKISDKSRDYSTHSQSISPDQLKTIAQKFELSDFVSPYSTANLSEYFAEMVSRLLTKKYLNAKVTDRIVAFGTQVQNAPAVYWEQTDRICLPNVLEKAIATSQFAKNKPFAASDFEDICK